MSGKLSRFKYRWAVIVAILLLGAMGWAYQRYIDNELVPKDQLSLPNAQESAIPPAEKPQEETEASVAYGAEQVVSGLVVPWSIAWTSPDRMLVAERPGRIRVVNQSVLVSAPLFTFSDVSTRSEEGLMGLVVDPSYATNHFLYACYAYTSGGRMVDKVVRLVDEGASARIEKVLLDQIPAAQYHAGCRLAFGPDGKLYITTGDATERTLAQRLDSLAGKILRINPDGSYPEGNPFPNSPIWTLGHRNPQGIAWHPISGELYESEHGPTAGFDGPAGGDQVNRIVRGLNYGWPLVHHDERREGTVPPLWFSGSVAEAPASAAFVSSRKIPQFQNNFFVGALKGEGIWRFVFDVADPDKIAGVEKLPEVTFGRIRAVAEGPDGYLYFSTSNRDGRGNPAPGDDRIFRLKPVSVP